MMTSRAIGHLGDRAGCKLVCRGHGSRWRVALCRSDRHLAGMARFAVLVGIAGVLTGCGIIGGPRNYENDNDRLRSENLQLQRQLEQTKAQLDRRADEISNLRQRLDGDQASMPNVEAPELVNLVIGRYSSAIDSDGDGVDDRIRLYVMPQDQRGRTLPVAGRALIRALHLGDNSSEPRIIAERVYEPPQLSDAYRSSFTGTHFTLELPLPQPLPANMPQPLTVQVQLKQAPSGDEFQAQQPFHISRETGESSGGGESANNPNS